MIYRKYAMGTYYPNAKSIKKRKPYRTIGKKIRDIKRLLIILAIYISSHFIYQEYHSLFSIMIENVPAIAEAKIVQNLPIEKIPDLSVEQQIKSIAKEKNFRWPDYLMRLARCENDTFDSLRTNTRNNTPKSSIDRGIFMINDYWHSEVSDECAFDVRCSTEWTINMINSGRQSEWICDSIIRN